MRVTTLRDGFLIPLRSVYLSRVRENNFARLKGDAQKMSRALYAAE